MTDTSSVAKVLALSGGVGGAKLAAGLASVLEADRLLVMTNTGDDFCFQGLQVCPDLDSVMYAMAGINDRERGWGLEQESWQFMAALDRIGGETWFQLGDRDLATHVQRSHLLAQGRSLTQATSAMCEALGITQQQIVPMSDDSVQTIVQTEAGDLEFQEYFVARQCQPKVTGFYFKGIEQAQTQSDVLAAIGDVQAIIICPSNPFVSVDPIVSLPGFRQLVSQCQAPRVAVSPIIGGKTIKGPAAKMMRELGLSTDALGVAQYYQQPGSVVNGQRARPLLSHFVIDHVDAGLASAIAALGLEVLITDTIMKTAQDQHRLAEFIVRELALI